MTENWVIFKDVDTESTQLFSGADVYAFINTIKISNNNILTPTQVSLADWEINAEDVTLATNIDRRRPYISYSTVNQNVIQITGIYVKELASGIDIGNTANIPGAGADTELLTPYKLMRMFYSGHKFYMKDSYFWDEFTNSTDDGESFYTSDGIPVIIKDVNFSSNSKNDSFINFSITLWEDRYTDI